VTAAVSTQRGDLFIGGDFVRSQSSEVVELISPVTEEIVGVVPASDPVDVDRAVGAARAALGSWRETSPSERADYLRAFADAYERRKHEISALVARENASPHWWTVQENENGAVGVYRFYAEVAAELVVEQVIEAGGRRAMIRREGAGVVGAIIPWNSPQVHLGMKVAAALAAGCTVVAKPSPETSLDSYIAAELWGEVGLPHGVVNIVTGGSETGAAIVRHSGVDKIAFTGSTATGKRVMMAAAERLTPVLMELGGKDAMIVDDDADLSAAAEACVYGALTNAGQACISVERVYVADAVHDRFVDEVVKQVRELKVGGDDGQLGAMTSAAQVDIVRDHLQDAISKGAKVRTGGPDAISGRYIQPTVLTDVDHRMKVMTDETFGPVIPIARVASADEAVKLANDSRYGLGSSVFAGRAARTIAGKLRAGMTSVNSVMAFAGIPSLPFGGVGESGFGRIHGDEGIREFTRVKSTAEQVVALPINMLSFKQPKDMTKRLRGMIKQLYGEGVVAKAGDLWRKLR
jgi:acyl-CoA reductase-like NAD-dependent aldehyde dehydrogenase